MENTPGMLGHLRGECRKTIERLRDELAVLGVELEQAKRDGDLAGTLRRFGEHLGKLDDAIKARVPENIGTYMREAVQGVAGAFGDEAAKRFAAAVGPIAEAISKLHALDEAYERVRAHAETQGVHIKDLEALRLAAETHAAELSAKLREYEANSKLQADETAKRMTELAGIRALCTKYEKEIGAYKGTAEKSAAEAKKHKAEATEALAELDKLRKQKGGATEEYRAVLDAFGYFAEKGFDKAASMIYRLCERQGVQGAAKRIAEIFSAETDPGKRYKALQSAK